jgi:hypothetical protein
MYHIMSCFNTWHELKRYSNGVIKPEFFLDQSRGAIWVTGHHQNDQISVSILSFEWRPAKGDSKSSTRAKTLQQKQDKKNFYSKN